jgi:hypothetical protein
MIEKIRGVSNPLTIIAIFAALAEVAGTISLATLDKSLQGTFIWFVMGFPTLLVISFLLILWTKPAVLYAPGDFKDEQNFLATQSAQIRVRDLDQRLQTFGLQISDSIADLIRDDTDRESIDATIAEQIAPIQMEVADAKRAIDSALQSIASRSDDSDINQKLATVRLVNSFISPQAVQRGKQVEITYEIESLHAIPEGVWLGSSIVVDSKTPEKLIFNTNEDQNIYLSAGRSLYRRVLTIPTDAPIGTYPIRTNIWYGAGGKKEGSRRLNPAGPIKNRIQILE